MQSDFFEHTKRSEHLPAVPFPLQKLGRGGLGLKISERRLILGLGDILMINAALTVYLLVQGRLSFTDGLLWDRVPWFITLTVMWLAAGTFFDNYDLSRAAKTVESAAMAGALALLVGGLYLLTPRFTPFLPDRRIYIFLLPLLAAGCVSVWRAAYANFITQPTFQRRLLIIGAGQSGEALVNVLGAQGQREGETAYNIVGFIDDEPEKLNQMVAKIPVLGNRYDLLNLARRLQPDEIVVAITHGHLIHPTLFKAVLDCREMGIPITTMAHLYEDLTGRVPVEHAGHDLQVVMPINRPASHRLYLTFRRAFEIVVALLGCLQLLLVIPLVWLANRFSAPGDLFYRQERVGEGGRVFNVIKFRSMIMNAEQGTGAVFAQKNDSRITPIGRFLRKTRLDELPQCWNVLKGEMSLIGPRPERPAIIATLEKEIPFYRVRHAVKPGITGWAQVCYRYGASVDDSLVKLEYDLYYIKHQSWLLDLSIIVKTARVMLGFQGQ